jgi:hypothetical protein
MSTIASTLANIERQIIVSPAVKICVEHLDHFDFDGGRRRLGLKEL